MSENSFDIICRRGGVADLSARTKLKLSGSDRRRYLNGQVTNDITRLEPGRSIYACVTGAKGKLQADVHVRFFPGDDDAYLIDADPTLRESLPARLEKYIIADDCAVEDVTDSFALFHVLSRADLHDTWSVSRDTLAASDEIPGDSHPIATSASNRFGIEGADFFVPSAMADGVLEALVSAYPGPASALLSGEVLDLVRITCGIPAWGRELTPDVLPPEAGLDDRAISYQKGCYIGQEVISRIKSVGKVNRHLCALAASDPGIDLDLRPGTPLFAEAPSGDGSQRPDGTLTSCAFSPGLDRWIALGFVRTALAEPGTQLVTGPRDNNLSCSLEIRKTPLQNPPSARA